MEQGFNRQRFLAAYEAARHCWAAANKSPATMGSGGAGRACCGAVAPSDRAFPSVNEVERRFYGFESVASTNQTAWELMRQTEPEPIVIALSQTAGRGQWGRQWQSERGGLYLSVGMRGAVPVANAAELTLCSAWGLAIALRTIPARLSGVEVGIPVQLKWLNDLVLEGRKLGGILTETRIQQRQITQAVIGVGLNWTNPVPETGIHLQAFLEHHPTPLIESLEMVAAIALQGIFAGVDYQQTGRMATVRSGYLNLLAHRDRPIAWEGREWVIVGIAPTGALRIQPKLAEIETNSANLPISEVDILIQPGTISLGYPL